MIPPESASPPAAPAARPGLEDGRGRRINYLRLSVTDRCNFRCSYCMPKEGLPLLEHGDVLSYEEFLRLCGLFARLGISRYKITGGEPFCRKGVAGFIDRLARVSGVNEITLTTNGAQLARHARDLAASGVAGVNVSLDAFDEETFSRITGSGAGLSAILDGMATAAALGLRVKINTVPIQGVNETHLVPLARFALERGYHIRFIELMPIGRGRALTGMGQDAVRRLMEEAFGPLSPVAEKTGNGPAVCARPDGMDGIIGFISPLSHAFCGLCNRVRLTSVGFLKTCLHHGEGVDLRALLRRGARDDELLAAMELAVRAKPSGHDFMAGTGSGGDFYMTRVGG